MAGGRGGPHVTSGSGGRRRVTGGRGRLRYTRDTYAAAGPRRRTDYEGGAPPKLRIIYVLRPGRRARKAGQPQAGLSWASAQLRQTQIMRDASFAARPRAGGTVGGYRGPPGSIDARGRTERDTRGRAGPLAAEDAPPGGRTRVCQSGWRPAARTPGRAASKYRTCQAQAGGGGTTPGGQTARDRPRHPRELYVESGQRVGGWAPWGRACAPKPGGGTTTLPQGCFVLCARSSYSNLFSTGGVGRRWTIKQPPDALTAYGGCDILEVDGCRRPTIIRGRVSHLSQRYYYIMGVIDCPDRPPHLIR